MFWVAISAWGAETAAESTYDRFVSMQDLRAESELVRPLAEPVTLTLGPEQLTLEGGWLVPVFSGRVSAAWQRTLDRWAAGHEPDDLPRRPTEEELGPQLLVGFVWTGGQGRLALQLPDRADAQLLANRMVTELAADRTQLAPFAHREAPLHVGVTDAIVLGLDAAVLSTFAGPGEHDPYEVLVVGTSSDARAAARHARGFLVQRLALWEELEKPLGDRIAWDRVLVERGIRAPAETFSAWDLATTERYGLVALDGGGDPDRALTVTRDPTGEVDERREIRISSAGLTPAGRAVDRTLGGVPHPPMVPGDPTSAPRPRLRADPVHAEVTLAVVPRGNVFSVHADETLVVRAVGGPLPWIDLNLPQVDASPNSFRVVAATLLDGTPLLGRPAKEKREPRPEKKPTPPPPQPRPGPGPIPTPAPPPPLTPPPIDPREALVRLHLPTPLPPGEEISVHLVFEDAWPYGNRAFGRGSSVIDLGNGSGLQRFLPLLRGHSLGSGWPLTVNVAIPEASQAKVVVSGQTVKEWVRPDGWRVIQASTGPVAAWFPGVAAGRFKTVDDPAQLGFPAVRAALFNTRYGTIEQFGPEVRRIIQFYQGWLPPFPTPEVEVFEAPASAFTMTWVAPDGLVAVQRMLTAGAVSNPRNGQPHLENAIFAHEIAHQYFGHLAPPASIEDFWISESFAELFACMYVAAAFDERDCRIRQENNRKSWERPERPLPNASLSRAYLDGARAAVIYDYGPYMLGEMLQRRIGRTAFFGAIDVLLREHADEPLTTERLQSYFEQAIGQDLGDLFAYWVYGGYVPALDLVWTTAGGDLVGTVTSDVPFGTFDVPVRVVVGERVIEQRVEVVDGVGPFTMALEGGEPDKVMLDPDGWVVASRRTVTTRK